MILLVVGLFLIVFPLFWLLVTSLLGALSGWFDLQKRFPDRIEPARERLFGLSAIMGLGINLGFALNLDVCPTGLRFSLLRILGPFQRPFFVPWDEIVAERRDMLFVKAVRLSLGRTRPGHIRISAWAFDRIAASSPLSL